jgi:tRNA uridine 5-carbamoylmethylation protein Kti12
VKYFNSKIDSSSDPRIQHLTVCHLNDQSLGVSRDVYREARTEKDARAEEYSAVKRALGRNTIVIADGLNYIKGFRYQLYCEAKAMQTPSCVVRAPLGERRNLHLASTDGSRDTRRDTDREMSRDQFGAFNGCGPRRRL